MILQFPLTRSLIDMSSFKKILISIFVLAFLTLFIASFVLSSESSYTKTKEVAGLATEVKLKEVKHLKTPEPLKAVYMTACYAGTPSLRAKLVKLIEETEINSIIIDIKDYTGTVSHDLGSSGTGCKVKDMPEFIESLHQKDIYVIGRVTVFQDPLFTKTHPDLAVKKKSDGSTWKDRKGLAFVDVGARPFWDYIIGIATSSYAMGYDEINFDYIRFPSDGDMKDIYFSHTGTTTKKDMLRKFFEYLDAKLAGTGIVTSADLFGMTTTNTDDLNIGQVLEYALLNFDYVAPMVYPSHYPPKFNGWPDPNKVPYEIIKFSMGSAVSRVNFLKKEIASSSPTSKILDRLGPQQLRPWLQDFDYPVPYTPAMVRTQIQATYDVGLTSWMLWDPSNTYTREALMSQSEL